MARMTQFPQSRSRSLSRGRSQWGGTLLGLVLGLICGLAIAVVVAVYITRAPVPLVIRNGAQPRPSEPGNVVSALPAPAQPAWQASAAAADPNAPLWNPEPARLPNLPAEPLAPGAGAAPPVRAASSAAAPAGSVPAQRASAPASPPAEKPAADPIAEIGRQDADRAGYFLQVGSYDSEGYAERQKGRLAMQGFEAQVTQREINGAIKYRVRLGPYRSIDDMTDARGRLQAAGTESTVIRFSR